MEVIITMPCALAAVLLQESRTDPMPCALAAVLLQESRTVDICRKPCFRDQSRVCTTLYACSARPDCRVRSYSVGGRRESERLPGCGSRCLAPRVGGGSWSSPSRGGARLGVVCERVGARRAERCLPTVQSRTCVDVWTGTVSGDSLRTVSLVAVWSLGLLLYGELVDYGNTPNNAYSQGVQELNTSAGVC